ncbi:DUF6531 domain-containing protein [Metapseudomonas otitidis]|nr:DUF6531 domain-containing protein [Pseudomonas otitidis]
MRYLSLAVAIGLAPLASQACTLSFTSPGEGATVRSPTITVYGVGGADAKEGDYGTVTATLNGSPFFNYSGSFTAAVSFLQGRGVGVTLRPGQNFLFVSGSVGGCSASDTMTITYDPELIQSKNKGMPPPNSCHGNPINTAVGNKYQAELDYQSNTAPLLRFERRYNSFDGYWRHTYSTHLVIGATSLRLILADGREVEFARSGNTVTASSDEFGKLSPAADGWVYASADQEQFHFDAQGRLKRQADSEGRSLVLSYNDALVTVTSDTGQSLGFTQDTRQQPLTLEAPGTSVQYEYDIRKRLIGLKKSLDGATTTRRFLYENAQYPRFLTGITDERGIRYATWTYDDQGRAISSEHAGGAEKVTVAYNADGSSTVTNALGKRTTYRFQTIQGVRRITAIEGEPSANCPNSNATFTYDDRGLVKTRTDNKGHVTTFDYNDRGLEVSRTEAYGTPQARTVITEWHPTLFLPLTVTEPDRVTTYRYDDQGRQLSQSVSQR